MAARPALPSSRGARRALAGIAALAALKAGALVLLFGALAQALGALAGGTGQDSVALWVQGTGGALLLGATTWGQQLAARRAALGAKEELRGRLMAHRLAGPGAPGQAGTGDDVGAEAMLASRGLDGLDGYFSAYLPALVSCAVLPALIGLRILAADWISALVIVLTIPLVPVFMILIGFHTQDRVQEAARGLDRLSNHLLELARGLPVLVGLRRAGAQRQALADVSEHYRRGTMGTLRTAFLSSLALELISTISVAVVAVFVGVRLVGGDLSLEAGLLALMLAPECFRPLRDVGAAHHGSEDGVEALRRVEAILAEPAPGRPAPDGEILAGRVLHVRDLTVTYAGRTEPALAGFHLDLTPGGTAVLDTASGTGKSTALAALAGVLHDDALVIGELHRPDADRVVWVSQHPRFTEPTVGEELALYAGGPEGRTADPAAIGAALEAVAAAHLLHRAPEDCSPGELRRVAVARALCRIAVDPGIELALFDEPTAHLDPVSAAAVRRALAQLNGSVAVVVASHDRGLSLEPGSSDQRGLGGSTSQLDAEGLDGSDPEGLDGPDSRRPDSGGSDSRAAPRFRWRWLRRLPLLSPRFGAGVVVAALASLSAAALSGLSGWLIVWAAAQPPIMYLMTLIVGVRTFGIGRSVLRYCERLLTHDAVLRWAGTLRLQLWDALGTNVRHWGRLTRSGGALGTLVADVDELRDAVPRAIVPLPAAVLSYLAIGAVVFWLVPDAAPAVWLLGLATLVLVPALVLAAASRSAAAAAVHRSWLATRATTLFAAASDLRANAVGAVQARRFTSTDAGVGAPLRRMAWAAGLGQAAVSALTALAAVVVTAAAVDAGADARAAAVAALLMLALAEPLGQYVAAVAELPVVATMMRRTMVLLDSAPTVVADGKGQPGVEGMTEGMTEVQRVTDIALDNVTARYPETTEPVFSQISGAVSRSGWWTVTGPSGSGKSTLLAVLLGFLPPAAGRYTLNAEPPTAAALRQVAWCPQDAYLFNSTLRANLALGRPAATPPADRELVQALATVGLGPWYRGLPDGLDTRVGPGGHHLSGGQRSRVSVARTLVADAAVVLLDEPTAHLGADESTALVADLRSALADAAVVLVTHDGALADARDVRLELAEGRAPLAAVRG